MFKLPTRMREVFFDGAGGPEVVKLREAGTPEAGAGKVLIEVVAAGVNRPDCVQRAGLYPPPPGESQVPGLEIAGRIVALGEGVSALKPGEEVCALVGSGGYADYCVADAALCLPRPRPLSLTQAAGVPENYFTVFDNVFSRGQLKSGETFLVHGGSSGIGSAAIQLAKYFGAKVIATAGSADKCRFCESLGADHSINYRDQDFVEEVKKITAKRGVDVILDMVGGPYIAKNIAILGIDGRLVQIGLQLGAFAEKVNWTPVMVRRLTLTGSTLRPRTLAHKAAIAEALRNKVWPILEEGRIKPIVHATFALEDAAKAHEMMETSSHSGKIILTTGKS